MKKRALYLLIIALFVFFILRNLNDGRKIAELLVKARWEFVLTAVFLQMLRTLLTSLLHKKALNFYEAKWNLKEVTSLVLASLSVNVFAPFAPFPGSAIFLKKARSEKIPALNIIAAIFLVVLSDYLALTPLLAASIYYQILNRNIFFYEILGVIIFIFLIVFLSSILLFGIVSPRILAALFSLIEKIINKVHFIFKQRDYFIKGWSSSRTLQFIDLSKKLFLEGNKKRNLFTIAFTRHLLDISTLYLLFIAFGYQIPIPVLFIGYSLLMLFWIVSPTPQGVGFVEAITPPIFSSMGINVETATLAVLAFRALNLWLPVLLGFYFFHRIFNDSPK